VGLRDLFSGSGRGKSRVDKLIKTAVNKYTQSAERYAAMEELLKDGSDEALIGVMRRFTIVSSKSIEDEEEKGWAYRRLSELGESVLPAVKAFCLEHDNIAWVLRLIEDCDETQEWQILDALLKQHPPSYERDPSKKLQLLTHVAEIDDDAVAGILAGYLSDPDEGIRFFSTEQLLDIADEKTKPKLVERILDEEEDSVRLRTKVLDGLADLDWDVSEWAEQLPARIGAEHTVRKGRIVKN